MRSARAMGATVALAAIMGLATSCQRILGNYIVLTREADGDIAYLFEPCDGEAVEWVSVARPLAALEVSRPDTGDAPVTGVVASSDPREDVTIEVKTSNGSYGASFDPGAIPRDGSVLGSGHAITLDELRAMRVEDCAERMTVRNRTGWFWYGFLIVGSIAVAFVLVLLLLILLLRWSSRRADEPEQPEPPNGPIEGGPPAIPGLGG